MTTKKRGRPTMPPAEKKQPFTTKISPDLLEWLEDMRQAGYAKAKVIDWALRDFKGKGGL
jgi:uncharacterized protein (DUF4415 family)